MWQFSRLTQSGTRMSGWLIRALPKVYVNTAIHFVGAIWNWWNKSLIPRKGESVVKALFYKNTFSDYVLQEPEMRRSRCPSHCWTKWVSFFSPTKFFFYTRVVYCWQWIFLQWSYFALKLRLITLLGSLSCNHLVCGMLPFGIVNVHHRGKDEMNGNMNLALGLNSDISSSSFGCEICVEEAPRIHITHCYHWNCEA